MVPKMDMIYLALQSISEWIKIPIIASGGVGKLGTHQDAFQIGNADAAPAHQFFTLENTV